MRARSRLSRRPCWSRKISVTARATRNGLIGQDEGIEADGEMRLVGEAAADAQRVADLAVVLGGGEADVVDLRIGAPGRAAGGGDLELARQVVELGIGGEQVARFRARAARRQ